VNWLLVLHISALVFWVAGLVYIPALLAGNLRSGDGDGDGDGAEVDGAPGPKLPRVMFTHAVTPCALAAIIAGTLIFVFHYTIGTWLIVKLSLVVLFVVNHVWLGLLIMRAEADTGKSVRRWCVASSTVTCVLAVSVLWVVLAKPALESLP